MPATYPNQPRPTFRPTPLQVGLGTALAILIFVYPFVFNHLIANYGVRAGAIALMIYAAFFAFARVEMGLPIALLSLPNLGVAAIAAITWITQDIRYVLLVPALIYLMIGRYFWSTLRDEITIIEHVARFIVPVSPDFIRPYCRRSTIGWCIFFAINAAVIAWLALSGRVEAWRDYTGWQMFAIIGAICLVDFLFRKWWFRYYQSHNPFDRVWSKIFPAENTERGRRSMEYLRKRRQELGMPPP